MLETAKYRTDTAASFKASHPPVPSFLQEYSQKRDASIRLQSKEGLRDKAVSDFIGGNINDMLTPEYSDWLQMRMEENVEFLAHKTDPDRFINLFDRAKKKIIDDNQGFQDAGDGIWLARRKANIRGQVIPVTIGLFGTTPDSAFGMRISVSGVDSHLHIHKYNGIWETVHTERYELEGEDAKDLTKAERTQHRNVHVKASETDHQFYNMVVVTLQTNPQLLDR